MINRRDDNMDEKRNEILGVVAEAITEMLGYTASEVTEDKNLTDDLGVDDIFAIRLMMKCEKKLNITIADTYFVPSNDIPKSEMWRCGTVGVLVDFLIGTVNSREQ